VHTGEGRGPEPCISSATLACISRSVAASFISLRWCFISSNTYSWSTRCSREGPWGCISSGGQASHGASRRVRGHHDRRTRGSAWTSASACRMRRWRALAIGGGEDGSRQPSKVEEMGRAGGRNWRRRWGAPDLEKEMWRAGRRRCN